MKRYLSLGIIILGCSLQVICQNFGTDKRDSLRFDSLRKMIAHSEGKQKVDLFNALSEMSQLIAAGWDTILMRRKYDTIKHYGSKAYELATKIGYSDGIAMSLINLSQHGSPETMPPSPPLDEDIRIQNILKAIKLAEASNNYDILGKGYDALGTLAPPSEADENFLDRFKKSEYYYQKALDTEALANTYTWVTSWYADNGNYEKAFEYGKKSLDYLKKEDVKLVNWHHFLVQQALWQMADLYTVVGDYESSMNYFKQANVHGLKNNTGWLMNAAMANLFCDMKKYDSALVYWKLWRNETHYEEMAGGAKAFGYGILAEICIAKKRYDSAIQISNDNVERMKPYNNYWGFAHEWFRIARIYNEKAEYNKALEYLNRSFALSANYPPAQSEMMKRYQVLSSVYHNLGNNDSAYKYLLKYISIKDSIENKQFLLRMYNSKRETEDAKKESRIGLLNRDNQIKQQKLKQEATFRNFLIAAMIAIFFAGLYVFRNINLKRKNEKLKLEQKEQEWKLKELESENKHIELQKQATELEMQALRAQMNPHFIFNSLSSINHFILKNESKTASNYLTRFSRLIRMVLLNSQRPLITLQDELEMLRIYLDMERIRFKNSFDYVISFINEIDAENVFVPPLILQPFCENAIWHGLMNKEGQGHLSIDLSTIENVLQCVITDDGVGREKAAELKSKSAEREKSLGLQITTQRLALLNQNKNVQTFYTIEDIVNDNKSIAGTKVILKISHNELKEELA